jgi:hypothetical protein
MLADVGLVLLVGFDWRFLRIAVLATPECLVIRNFRNTHRIPWDQIEEIFVPGPVPPAVYLENPLARQKYGLFVRLTEGAVISCTLFDPSWFARRGEYEVPGTKKAVLELSELRERHAPRGGPSSDVAGSAPDLLS